VQFSRGQWLAWGLGLVATLVLLTAPGTFKGGPTWVFPIVLGAAAYCVVTQVVVLVLRRLARNGQESAWASALSTSFPGLLVAVVLGAVVAVIILLRP
jgi:hypothetical protein